MLFCGLFGFFFCLAVHLSILRHEENLNCLKLTKWLVVWLSVWPSWANNQVTAPRAGLWAEQRYLLQFGTTTVWFSVSSVYSCLFFVVVVVAVVFSSSVRAPSWPDSPFWVLHWSGCPVLKEDLSHYKQKWRGQSKCCSCLRTWCQCQTACCLDTEHRGLALGFGNVQKVSWIITLLQPQKDISPSLLCVRFCFTNDRFFSCLFHSKWWACKKLQPISSLISFFFFSRLTPSGSW